MNITIPIHRTISLALAVTGLFIAANLAADQQETEEIVVKAPFERIKVRSAPGSSLDAEIIELKRQVNIADLDLTKPADVKELDARINAIAKESCQKLSDMFPMDHSDPVEMNRCVKSAIASANKQKELAIAAGP